MPLAATPPSSVEVDTWSRFYDNIGQTPAVNLATFQNPSASTTLHDGVQHAADSLKRGVQTTPQRLINAYRSLQDFAHSRNVSLHNALDILHYFFPNNKMGVNLAITLFGHTVRSFILHSLNVVVNCMFPDAENRQLQYISGLNMLASLFFSFLCIDEEAMNVNKIIVNCCVLAAICNFWLLNPTLMTSYRNVRNYVAQLNSQWNNNNNNNRQQNNNSSMLLAKQFFTHAFSASFEIFTNMLFIAPFVIYNNLDFHKVLLKPVKHRNIQLMGSTITVPRLFSWIWNKNGHVENLLSHRYTSTSVIVGTTCVGLAIVGSIIYRVCKAMGVFNTRTRQQQRTIVSSSSLSSTTTDATTQQQQSNLDIDEEYKDSDNEINLTQQRKNGKKQHTNNNNNQQQQRVINLQQPQQQTNTLKNNNNNNNNNNNLLYTRAINMGINLFFYLGYLCLVNSDYHLFTPANVPGNVIPKASITGLTVNQDRILCAISSTCIVLHFMINSFFAFFDSLKHKLISPRTATTTTNREHIIMGSSRQQATTHNNDNNNNEQHDENTNDYHDGVTTRRRRAARREYVL